jgi:hypothetical protein
MREGVAWRGCLKGGFGGAQVVLEMVELREVDTARAMLRQTAVFAHMRQAEPDRFLRLDHLCGRAFFDIRCGRPCSITAKGSFPLRGHPACTTSSCAPS